MRLLTRWPRLRVDQRRELDDARSGEGYTIRERVEAPGVRYVPVDGDLRAPHRGELRVLALGVLEPRRPKWIGQPLERGQDILAV